MKVKVETKAPSGVELPPCPVCGRGVSGVGKAAPTRLRVESCNFALSGKKNHD